MFRWQGNGAGTKSAWNDGRNWVDQNDAPYPQARYPGSLAGTEDEVLLDIELATGALPLEGYDGTSLEVLKSFKIASAYQDTVGRAAAYLKIKAKEVIINSPKNTAGMYIHQLQNGSSTTVLGGSNINLAGDLDNFKALTGSGTIISGATLTKPFFGYVASTDTDTSWVIEEGVTVSEALQTGGYIDCYATLTQSSENGYLNDLTQHGGIWVQRANLTRYDGIGGTLNWLEGNIYEAKVSGAFIDASQGKAARIVTTLAVSGVTEIDINNGLANIRVGKYIDISGGTVHFSPQSRVSLKSKSAYFIIQDTATVAASDEYNSAWISLSEYEHLQAVIQDGGIAGLEDVVSGFYAASDSAGTDAEVVSNSLDYIEDLGIPSGVDVRQNSVWGYKLPAGKPYVSLKINNMTGQAVTVSVLGIKRSF